MELSVDIQKKLNGFNLNTSFDTSNKYLGLLGASGSGKSMTLRCIAGLDTPSKGKIILNGRTLFDSERGINLPPQKRRIGFLFQNYALFPHMTAAQNIRFALNDLPLTRQNEIVREKLKMVHLDGLEGRYPHQLSGGQQQRIALARALAINPEVLLLDEPFSALDNHLRERMEHQLVEALSAYRGAVVLVSHNIDEVYRMCSELVVLSEGMISASGSKEQIFEKPPTLPAAKLAGCKNISRVKAISGQLVEAIDWGCNIHIHEQLDPKISYIGIQSHYLDFVSEAKDDNVFQCLIENICESPYTTTIFFKLSGNTHHSDDSILRCSIPKEQYRYIKDKSQLYIRINPKKLFFMTE